MTQQKSSIFDTVMSWWEQHVLRFPWTLLLMSFFAVRVEFAMHNEYAGYRYPEMLPVNLNPLHLASMGLLLAIGITFTLLCSLIVLPAFSTLWRASGKRI